MGVIRAFSTSTILFGRTNAVNHFKDTISGSQNFLYIATDMFGPILYVSTHKSLMPPHTSIRPMQDIEHEIAFFEKVCDNTDGATKATLTLPHTPS